MNLLNSNTMSKILINKKTPNINQNLRTFWVFMFGIK